MPQNGKAQNAKAPNGRPPVSRAQRGQANKQRRLDYHDRQQQRLPWLMPVIVVVAAAVVVAGIVVAISLGHFF